MDQRGAILSSDWQIKEDFKKVGDWIMKIKGEEMNDVMNWLGRERGNSRFNLLELGR